MSYYPNQFPYQQPGYIPQTTVTTTGFLGQPYYQPQPTIVYANPPTYIQQQPPVIINSQPVAQQSNSGFTEGFIAGELAGNLSHHHHHHHLLRWWLND